MSLGIHILVAHPFKRGLWKDHPCTVPFFLPRPDMAMTPKLWVVRFDKSHGCWPMFATKKKLPGWFNYPSILGAENRCKRFWMCRFVMEPPTSPNVSKLQVGAPRSVCTVYYRLLRDWGQNLHLKTFEVCLKVRLIQWADRASNCLIMFVVSCSCFFGLNYEGKAHIFLLRKNAGKEIPISFHSRVLVWYRFWTIPWTKVGG